MPYFALLIPQDSYNSSVGACLDSYALVQKRVERLFSTTERVSLETKLHIVTPDGAPARLVDARTLAVDSRIDAGQSYDLVHVSSFRIEGSDGPALLEHRLAAAKPALSWLREQWEQGAIVSASGPSVLLLAAAGLTADLRVPVARTLVPEVRRLFPRLLIDERRSLIEHGRLLMCNGFDREAVMMVRLMELAISPEIGRWLGSMLGVDRVDSENLPDDALVADGQLWLEQRFTEEVRIAELARALSTTHQTLIRRFTRALGMSPQTYVQHLRVNSAKRMLRHTNRSIVQIAALVGYRDTRSFRSMFLTKTGVTPSTYRARARADVLRTGTPLA